jgi:hypothetical protein
MSQHHFRTERAGSPVAVLLGFDRPLGHYYLVVQDLAPQQRTSVPPSVRNDGMDEDDDEDAGDDGCLYSNLNEPDAFELSLEHYKAVLSRLGIQVPTTMFQQVELDALHRVGNRSVTYEPSGTFTEA